MTPHASGFDRCLASTTWRRWWPPCLVALGVAVRIPLLHVRSGDWVVYLSGWMNTLHERGLSAFSVRFTDYSFPYPFLLWAVGHLPVPALLALKLLSTSFDVLLAVAVALLARELIPQFRPLAVAAVTFALPTVVLNSAAWGQCDALYVSLMVFGLRAICRDKLNLAGLFFGIALAVKLQTIFVAPVLLLVWWYKRRPVGPLVIGASAFVALTIPPLAFGQPIGTVLTTYAHQTQEYGGLTLNAPNLYQWWPAGHAELGTRVAELLSLIALAALVALGFRRRPLTARGLVAYAALTLTVLPFVLPHMHERYFFPAELVTATLAFTNAHARLGAAFLQAASTVSYLVFLEWPTAIPLPVDALGVLAAVVCAVKVYVDETAATAKAAPGWPVAGLAHATRPGRVYDDVASDVAGVSS